MPCLTHMVMVQVGSLIPTCVMTDSYMCMRWPLSTVRPSSPSPSFAFPVVSPLSLYLPPSLNLPPSLSSSSILLRSSSSHHSLQHPPFLPLFTLTKPPTHAHTLSHVTDMERMVGCFLDA